MAKNVNWGPEFNPDHSKSLMVSIPVLYTPTHKFHQNPSDNFCAVLLTNRQTNGSDHHLLGRDKKNEDSEDPQRQNIIQIFILQKNDPEQTAAEDDI